MDDWKKILHTEQVRPLAVEVAKPRKKAGKIVLLVAALFFAAVFTVWLGTAVHRVYFYDRIYPSVFVLNVDVGGMTKAEAASALSAYSANFYSGKQIILEYGDIRTVITAKDVDLGIDAVAAASAAFDYGRKGSFFARYKASFSTPSEPIAVAGAMYDRARAEAVVSQFADAVFVEHKNFGYKLGDEGLTIYRGQNGISINKSELLAKVTEMLDTGQFGTIYPLLEVTPADPPDWNVLRNTFYVAPQDAVVEKSGTKGYRIVPGFAGKDIDMEQLIKDMEEPGWEEKFYPFLITEPEISVQALSAVLFRDVLGESITKLNPAELNRTTNVRLAAEKVHDVILLPGEEFSFNKIVGERTENRGFKSAKVFAQGEVVDDIGGGICQVSSALYVATLYADLEVTERKTHAFVVSYVPIGQDATIQWGYLDYRFVNNTAMPMRISAALSGDTLTVRFYGTKDNPNKTVRLESAVTESIPFETRRVYNASLSDGATREIQRGNAGARSETYQSIYEGETLVERRLANKSYYSSQPQIIEYGS